MASHSSSRLAVFLPWLLVLLGTPAHGAPLSFTVATSEPVLVTGTPRIAIDVGGTTRYATYAAGSGTSSLSFSYTVQPGDFDANGIVITSPLDLNGGTLTDLAGNPPAALTFTVPDTSAIKVQTYTADFTTSPITNSNANAVSFAIAKAPTGAAFTYAITSSGGAGSVTGSGTIGSTSHTVPGVDVSALPAGTLTLSVTVSTAAGGTGAARTATAATSFTGVLDALPSTVAAFSIRRLSATYSGPLLRVRRASDNARQDIGATVAGNLNTAALTSFCGSASCFVATLYDQSGLGWHAMQAVDASQPRIASAGAVETEGARPALRYTAGGQGLSAPAIPGQSLVGSFNAVARCSDTTTARHVMGDRSLAVNAGRSIRSMGAASYAAYNMGGAIISMTGATTQQRVISIMSSATGMIGALDGTLSLPSNNTYYLSSGSIFWIGGGGISQTSGDWIGTISEATVFNVTLSTAQRQTLERNQGAYYGITVQ